MNHTPISIVRRRVDIDFATAPPEHWYPSQAWTESLLNAISFFFPAGEKFFIESVQHYQERITDPVLMDQVRRFIYQEAMHTREHVLCNRLLVKSFPQGPHIERVGEICLNLARWFTPKAFQLAVSCALEHYTATMSDDLLRRQCHFIAQVPPAFAQLWLWHAVEETEHKAVCYDVYQQVVGKGPIAYLNRIFAMIVTTAYFTVAVAIGVSLIKRNKGRKQGTATPERKTSHAQYKASRRGTLRLAITLIPWRQYFDYFRPSFHPWDNDNSHLIEEWKQRFPGFGTSPDTDNKAAEH